MERLTPKQLENVKRVVIETTTRCNLRCENCYRYQQSGLIERDMDFDVFKRIIDQLPENTYTTLFMYGDPFCHHNFIEYLDYATSRVKACFSTNGMIPNYGLIDHALKQQRVYQILFSIDGTSKDAIECLRPGSNKEQVEEFILYAISKKASLSSGCDIGVRMCDKGQEWGEAVDFISKWIERGADFVMIGKELWFGNSRKYENRYGCRFLEGDNLVFNALGEMLLCERAGDNKVVIGNVMDESIEDLYKRQLLIRPDYCKTCLCPFNEGFISGTVITRNGTELTFKEDYFQRIYSKKKALDGVAFTNKPDSAGR